MADEVERKYLMTDMPIFASCALDIGVYNLGGKGQVLSSTTAAWARAVDSITSIQEIKHSGSLDAGEFADSSGHTWPCGRKVGTLADRIGRDLDAGLNVALGFEAPMWFPISREERAGLQLFGPRFEAERGSEWYLQSGTAATLKALSLGSMVLSQIVANRPTLRFSTEPVANREPAVVLFEAFVAASYKVVPPAGAAAMPDHWDALTASLAWGALNADVELPPNLKAVQLHPRGSHPGDTVSVWHVIAHTLPKALAIYGPSDCQVVGLSLIREQANLALEPSAPRAT